MVTLFCKVFSRRKKCDVTTRQNNIISHAGARIQRLIFCVHAVQFSTSAKQCQTQNPSKVIHVVSKKRRRGMCFNKKKKKGKLTRRKKLPKVIVAQHVPKLSGRGQFCFIFIKHNIKFTINYIGCSKKKTINYIGNEVQ